MPVIVQKYGGSSLATPDLIKSVASRICSAHDSGNSVVATVSAMGDSTDDLISIASQVSVMPDLRELDVLLSTGELQSCALVAMALKDMGKNAVSLSGAQAGIRTDSSYGKAKIADIDTGRIEEELGSGNIVIVAGNIIKKIGPILTHFPPQNCTDIRSAAGSQELSAKTYTQRG